MKSTQTSLFLTLRKGFTLIELLVVIAVIAILAAIAVPGFGWAFRSVKNAESTSMAVTVVQAIEGLYNESHFLPWTETAAGLDTNDDLLSHLTRVTATNRSGTVYLDMNVQVDKGGGLFQTGTTAGGSATYELYDSWKDTPTMFKFSVDKDGDGEIARPAGYEGSGTVPLRQVAIVHSAGADRDFADAKDNPNSWGD